MDTRSKLSGVRVAPRPKLIVLSVVAALAQLAAGAASADSGVGVDTVLGNAMNPKSVDAQREHDPDGMGEAQHQRTPTGFMHARPFLESEPTKTESGWQYSGSVEAGVLGGDANEKSALFRKYKDLDNGLYLNRFHVQAEKPDAARYVEVLGGGVGHDDQFYGLRFGRYNDWKVQAFYNETPHVFTDRYRNLWSGTGSSTLTLNSLTPGGTTSAAVTNTNLRTVVTATPFSELGLVRKKGGVRFDKYLSPEWKFFGSYTNEKREGARPFSAVFGAGGGTGGIEIPESIDSTTHDMVAGVQWADALSSFNAQLSASFFRNDIDTLTFDNPLFLAAANGIASFPQGRFDLHPDNDYLNLKGEYARRFPSFYDSRFTAVVSSSRLRQNDDLVPSTMYPGAVVNGVAGGAWDTTASLSQQSGNAKIDTQLVDLGFSLRPASSVDVKAKLRYYDTDNKTDYLACNPLTGQWGRLTNDGSGAAMVNVPAYLAARCDLAAVEAMGIAPNAGNVNIRSVPYQYTQKNYGVSADWRFDRSNSFNAAIEREEFEREYRERKDTWENKFKLGYVNRSLERGTVRVSFEHGSRRGSEYISDPYEEFFSVGLGPLPTGGATATSVNSWIHVLAQMRKFDLADRDQNVLNARFNYALRPDLDAGFSMQLKDADYPDSDYGRNGHQKQNSLNFDLNWQADANLSMFGFYSYQNGRIQQAAIQPGTACSIPAGGFSSTATTAALLDSCAQAGSTQFPLANRWATKQKDRSDVLGFGLSRSFGKVRFDANYTYVKSRSNIDYEYGAGLTGINAALTGDGFPDLRFRQSIAEASLLYPLSKQLAVRLLLRHESGKLDDWHYEGVAGNPVPGTNQQTYLDAGPSRYSALLVGAFVQFDF